MAKEIAGRTAIVTGAGRGIGRAAALGLAEIGACVVVNDIGQDADGLPTAAGVVAEIEALGGRAVASVESVGDFEAAGRIVAVAVDRFGSADILINNAGVAASGSIREIDEAEFLRVVPSQIAGRFNCTRQVVESMVERGWGRIVNLVSRAGITGIPGTIVYAMGKGAMLGLTNGASRELAAYGITVNGVCPSSTRTTMVESADAEMKQKDDQGRKRAECLLGQMQTPEEVARPIVAPCTDAASPINGQVFVVEHDRIGLFQPLTVTQQVMREADRGASQLAGALAELELHGLADA